MSAVGSALQDIASWVFSSAMYLSPFDASNRLHWTGLVAFFLLGLFAFQREKRTAIVSFLFPKHMYLSQSSGVDVKVYIVNKLLAPGLNTLSFSLKIFVVAAVASLIAPAAPPESMGLGTLALITVLYAIASDLSYYIVHRMSHENRLLWPFHKLHHSAEHLTPLTAKRNHPVFELILKLSNGMLSGLMGGLIFGLFGGTGLVTIFGVTLTIALFNFAGGALRHSHIWIDYGPVFDRIFISPAQHQIHHSSAPRHHDKNYGLMLAIWDWMFGTLYVPNEKEDLEFGIADKTGALLEQKHNNLKQALLVPFTEASEVLREQRAGEPEPAS